MAPPKEKSPERKTRSRTDWSRRLQSRVPIRSTVRATSSGRTTRTANTSSASVVGSSVGSLPKTPQLYVSVRPASHTRWPALLMLVPGHSNIPSALTFTSPGRMWAAKDSSSGLLGLTSLEPRPANQHGCSKSAAGGGCGSSGAWRSGAVFGRLSVHDTPRPWSVGVALAGAATPTTVTDALSRAATAEGGGPRSPAHSRRVSRTSDPAGGAHSTYAMAGSHGVSRERLKLVPHLYVSSRGDNKKSDGRPEGHARMCNPAPIEDPNLENGPKREGSAITARPKDRRPSSESRTPCEEALPFGAKVNARTDRPTGSPLAVHIVP
ncbi:hypothetical protein I4F81_008296 [Pyropia yezoensis]|uniref:Uncharacterized protein n=1 Tax=Pyropia yezoensis TaxID=2788 RepID=A0ACC3C7N2_PYRYE|nr:hypothetical protein I4F81_008296 [Neopyropia yezoensis]